MSTPWGFNGLGYVVYKRTYSRNNEEWVNTIERVVRGCRTQLKCNFTPEEEDELRDMMLNLRGTVAGRFLWQLGTKTVNDLGMLSLQNCAFTLVNHPIEPFVWTMDALMLGCGVGYNLQREHVNEIPKVVKRKIKICRKDTKDADFIVPDSREGWCELLKRVLESHFITGKGFSYSTICVRSKGAPIKGFGGIASGPEELCQGIGWISEILNGRAGKKVRSIDCLDIMNILGFIVVAGNVRRSAQIAIGDYDDFQFLKAKRWDLGGIPSWRSMSNNSVVCNNISDLPEQFWHGYEGNGEPYGLINLKLSQSIGRIGDTSRPDPDVMGFNPCAEQSLADKETCCLAEVFLPHIKSKEELWTTVKLLYRINKHSLALKCHQETTEKIVNSNMRMGIGVTGVMQALDKLGWLDETYKKLVDYDKEYSKKHNMPTSIKLTTIKPSGTLSLLAGTTPGVHPGYAKHHIRRVRIASNHELSRTLVNAGYKSEYQLNFDGSADKSTLVFEFPASFPEGTKMAHEMTAIDQLEAMKNMQTIWSDNAVSNTIYYKKEELLSIRKWLADNYNEGVKSCSFLLHSEHGFKQAPLEEISENEYNELVAGLKDLNNLTVDEDAISEDQIGCESGACPIK